MKSSDDAASGMTSRLPAIVSRYWGPALGVVIVLLVGYMFVAEALSGGPCDEERKTADAYNIVLGIPEPGDSDWRRAYDEAERRYPDLTNEREAAVNSLVTCELAED